MKTKLDNAVWGLLERVWDNAVRWVRDVHIKQDGDWYEDDDTRPLVYYEIARELYEDKD